MGFEHGVAPVLADVDGDLGDEIAVLSFAGDMVLFDGPDGNPLWRTTLPHHPVAEAAAVIAPDRSFDIVVVDASGALVWVDGSSGRLIQTLPLGAAPRAIPAVADLTGDDRDELLVVTAAPALQILSSDNAADELQVIRTLPLVANGGIPPSVGDVTGDDVPDLIVADRVDGVAVMSLEGTRIASWAGRDALATPLTLAELSGDGGLEIVLADRGGHVTVLGCVGGETPTLAAFGISAAPPDTRFGVLSAFDAPEGGSGTIFLCTRSTLRAVDGLTGQYLWTSVLNWAPQTPTAMAPLPAPGASRGSVPSESPHDAGAGRQEAVSGILALVDTEGRLVILDARSGETLGQVSTGGRSGAVPLLADLDGDGDLDLFTLSTRGNRGRGQAWGTDLAVERFAPLWISELGTPANAGHWLPAQRERLLQQRQGFHARLEGRALEAEEALAQGELERARAAATVVLSWDPKHRRARHVFDVITRPQRLWRAILVALTIVATVSVAAFLARRHLHRRALQRRLEAARQEGRWAEAVRLLEPELRRHPRDRTLRHALAEAHIALGHFDARTRALIAELAAAFPTDAHRWALAQCHLNEGDESPEAIAVYTDLMRRGRTDLPLLRALGRALLTQGKPAEALPALREAHRQDPDDVKLGRLLCEAQMATGQIDESFLRAAAAQVRLGNAAPALCKALCRCAVERRGVATPGVEAAAEARLSQEPTDPWALLCRALLCVDRGAWDEIPPLLERLPHEGPTVAHALPLWGLLAAEMQSERGDEILRRLCHGTPAPEPRLVVRIAERLAASGRRDELAQAFCELAATDPACPPAVLEALAECLARAGNAQAQAAVLGRLAQAEPQRSERWLAFGLLCARLHRTDDAAREAYLRLLDQPPADPESLSLLLTACGEAEVRDPRVSALAERLAEQRPDDPQLGLLLIRVLLDQGAVAEAHRRGLQIAAQVPETDVAATELLARAAFEARDFEHAEGLCRRLRAAQPEVNAWARQLSLCLSRMGRHDPETIALHREVARACPGDPTAQMILARALIEAGHVAEGIGEVREMLRQHADLAPQIVRMLTSLLPSLHGEAGDPVHMLLADMLGEQGEFTEAASHLSALAGASPAEAEPLFEKIERLAAKEPESLDALMALGILALKRGQPQRARDVLEKAAALEPGSPDVKALLVECDEHIVAEHDTAENRLRLGEGYIAADRPDDALRVLQPIQDDVFLYRPIRLALARAYLRKEMLELASQAMETVTLDDLSKPVLYELGEKLVAAGQLEQARDIWGKLYAADIGYQDIRTRYERLVEDLRRQRTAAGRAAVTGGASLASVGDQMFRERFELLEEVGVGGMGHVYRARDKQLDEIVALKILPPHLADNSEIVERLKREVRAARQLTHPHIIRIHDFGALGGQKFLSMEFIDGPTLKALIRRGPGLTNAQKLAFARQIADALAYAHRRGIIHRDVKPANILVAEGDQLKITDFGIAKVVSAAGGHSTITEQIVGTPLYMAPEQIRGDEVDGRADIYSFGISLFEMIMGHPPFQEGDLAYQHLTVPAPEVEHVSPRLQRLVARCVAKAPADRWPRFEEILDELMAMDEADLAF